MNKIFVNTLIRIFFVSLFAILMLFRAGKLDLFEDAPHILPTWLFILLYITVFNLISEGNLFIDRHLNKKTPWLKDTGKRLWLQSGITVVWVLFILGNISILLTILNASGWHLSRFAIYTFFSALTFLLIYNAVYFGKNFLKQWRKSLDELKDKEIELVKNKYKKIFDFSPNGILTIDKKGQIIEYSKEADKILGLSKLHPEERTIYNKRWNRTNVDGHIIQPEEFVGIRAINENRHIENVEMQLLWQDKKIWLNVSAAPLGNGDGAVISYMVISDKKEREEQLKELNATKDLFFSILSHDLRSPFNSLLGFTDLLLTSHKSFSNDELEDVFKTIHQTSDKTYKLLNNLLLWAQSQKGDIQMNKERLNIFELANANIKLQTEPAQNKNTELINHIKEDRFVYADKNMMDTVIRNLLTNAIKYTEGGKITISSKMSSENIELSISDTGLGMNEATKNALFKVGETRSKEGTHSEKGTGLGLILCKDFIEKHKGQIWVESEEGKGSSFKFNIPISKM